MDSVSYTARDGLDIPAYLTLPAGRTPKNLPMVVMPHGGPFARDEWGFDTWAQFLASRGYVVLQPNFRGSTGYGRQFVEKGNGQWGRGMPVTVNQTIDQDTAELLVTEFGHNITRVSDSDVDLSTGAIEDAVETLKPRPPVVTIMAGSFSTNRLASARPRW